MRKGGRTTGLQQVAEGIDHWTKPSKLQARDSFPTGPGVSGLLLALLAWSNNKLCSNSSRLNVAFKVNWHKQILIYDQKTKTLATWIYLSFIFVATFVADNSQDLLTDLFFWAIHLKRLQSVTSSFTAFMNRASWRLLVIWTHRSPLSRNGASCFHYQLVYEGTAFRAEHIHAHSLCIYLKSTNFPAQYQEHFRVFCSLKPWNHSHVTIKNIEFPLQLCEVF